MSGVSWTMPPQLRGRILAASGTLLVALGLLHLAVTPFIADFVRNSAAPGAAGWLTPPMLLNHVVVGVLLLPLGALTLYAASPAGRGERWAIIVCRATALAIAALPAALFALMGTRYDAVPFRIAEGIVTAAAITLLAAAFWPPPGS